ncbi:helix-turn-helix domain-containing protein [Streptomyces sp. NPDC005776]|uniref:helix-turn-helix domain-containing protein n=1 Tax=Streptomyces sp. NPDC005776 TaxID=3154676 RepID=UPI0033E71F3C
MSPWPAHVARRTANAVIARMLRPHLDTVRRRRKWFTAEGLAALEDRRRPGLPRFVVHHTPEHASWLNRVEIFFSILARRLLRGGEFGAVRVPPGPRRATPRMHPRLRRPGPTIPTVLRQHPLKAA